MWTQQRIEQHIVERIEESLSLDYKAAGALDRRPEKKLEIQRDVSAFANSDGGVIIYGVREFSASDKKHLPERIDPIAREAFSKEWLEQVISGIQPRINGVIIHPVPLSSGTDHCCYVVEIPMSETVHQVPDGRYYRRYNFENRIMPDYEIREAMNRARHPAIETSVHLNLENAWEGEGCFLVILRNISRRKANDFICTVHHPLEISGHALEPEEPRLIGEDPDGRSYVEFSLPHSLNRPPLFPGADVRLKKKLKIGGVWNPKSGRPLTSIDEIRITVYADEMEAVTRSIPVADALKGWI